MKEKEYTQEEISELWDDFGDIPVNEDEEIEEDFHIWKAGTDKYDIWHWFDAKFENGLGKTKF